MYRNPNYKRRRRIDTIPKRLQYAPRRRDCKDALLYVRYQPRNHFSPLLSPTYCLLTAHSSCIIHIITSDSYPLPVLHQILAACAFPILICRPLLLALTTQDNVTDVVPSLLMSTSFSPVRAGRSWQLTLSRSGITVIRVTRLRVPTILAPVVVPLSRGRRWHCERLRLCVIRGRYVQCSFDAITTDAAEERALIGEIG
jgi:hypothetical protein